MLDRLTTATDVGFAVIATALLYRSSFRFGILWRFLACISTLYRLHDIRSLSGPSNTPFSPIMQPLPNIYAHTLTGDDRHAYITIVYS